MKFISIILLAIMPMFVFAQQSAPIVKKEEANKAPQELTCEKKEMKNGKCPKVFPKAPKPTDKQLEDAKKKADTKK